MAFTNDFYSPDKVLFFDLDAVYDMSGVVQKWHQPVKHGSVLEPERPWEGDMVLPDSVFPHHDGQRIICKYRGHHHASRFPELTEAGMAATVAWAESTDGLHWARPDLGLVEFQGSRQNNLLPGKNFRAILDPHASDPEQRYKGIALCWPGDFPAARIEDQREGRCFYSATSPDAIHWSAPRCMAGFEETGDTESLTWDDRQQQYLFTTRKRGYWLSDAYPEFYKRPIKKGMPNGRWVALSTSSDFEQWSELDNIIVRDPMDELGVDFYCACIFPYGNLYLGWLRRHHSWHGLMDTELVWSYDLRRWHRSWYRRPFVSWGELGQDDWCFGNVTNSKPIRIGDQLHIFCESRNHVHAPHATKQRGLLGMDARLDVATLRLDGFVSLEAGRMGGELITEPLPIAGKKLHMNARTVGDGVIEMELLTPDREPLGREPLVFRGDNVAHTVAFDNLDAIPNTDSGLAVLRMFLQNAALYSFTLGE